MTPKAVHSQRLGPAVLPWPGRDHKALWTHLSGGQKDVSSKEGGHGVVGNDMEH